MRTVTLKLMVLLSPMMLVTTGLYVPVTRTAICWWNPAEFQAGLPVGFRSGGVWYRDASGTANTSNVHPVIWFSTPHIPVPYWRLFHIPVCQTCWTSAV